MYDLTGRRFGRLTVLAQAASAKQRRRWHCACDCGAETAVTTNHLTAGSVRSCGCLAREMAVERQRLFDEERVLRGPDAATKDPTWSIWRGVVLRCTVPASDNAAVHPRWTGPYGYRRFLTDLGERPTPEHRLVRVDPEAPYAKDNCAWLKRKGAA